MKCAVSQLSSLDARRICIIKPSALGDVVQSLPLLPALRRRFPQAQVHWVINREFVGLLEGNSALAEVIPFDRRGTWRDFIRLLIELRRRRFDLVFDLQGLLRSAAMTLATGAAVRIGLETAREGAGRACQLVVPGTDWSVPAHQRCRNVAAALGSCDPAAESGLEIRAPARQWSTARLHALRRPILAIHPGAGWETKRWPVEKFAQVAERFGGSVVAVGSRSEAALTRPIVEAVAAAGGQALDLAGETSLPQLAAVLEAADLMLSNDSGPMHLAAALGTSVVGVFTCTSPVISGPAGSGHELVATGVSCAASYRKRCPHAGPAHQACLEEISVERVRQAVARAASRQTPKRRSA